MVTIKVLSGHTLSYDVFITYIIAAMYKAYVIYDGGLVFDAYDMYCIIIDIVIWSIYHCPLMPWTHAISYFWHV